MLPKFLTKSKIVFFFLTLLILFFSLAKPILAFSSPTIKGGYYWNFENAVYKMPEQMNLQSFVNETLKAVVGSITTAIIGCQSCTPEEKENFPGLLSATGYMIAGVYTNPPASGIQYLADLGNRLGIVKPAYAQEEGIGFSAMEVIRPIWTAFRNISYVFFVLILVFMGFAIMFRVKLDPQTVITIQSALPKIVVALILITFSYAIVGLMIDFMYVFMGLISEIFIGSNGVMRTIEGIPELIAALSDFVGDFLGRTTHNIILSETLATGLFFTIAALLSFVVAFLIGPIGWLLAIVAIILILIAMLRCLWTLLKTLAMIIVSLIFAPLQIMVGVLPGSNAIGSWFRGLIANIAVLPTMLVIFYIANYLMLTGIAEIIEDPISLLTAMAMGWLGAPAAVPLATLAVLKGDIATFWQFFSVILLPIIGLMILLMAPKVSDMIKSSLAGKPFEYGTAIGEAMTPVRIGAAFGLGPGSERISRGMGRVQQERFMTVIGELQKMLTRGSIS